MSTDSGNKKQDKVLVKATDLARHGNPYPPKDSVIDDTPSMLEAKISSIKSSIRPYTQPITSVYSSASDFVGIGVAHSSSAWDRFTEGKGSFYSGFFLTAGALLAVAVAKRRKFLSGAILATGAMVALFPKEAEEKSQMMWYIARNKLPVVAKQQYQKLVSGNSSQQNETSSNKNVTTDQTTK